LVEGNLRYFFVT